MKGKLHIKMFVFPTGELYPVLINDVGVPHHFITFYTALRLLNANKTPTTIAACLSALKILSQWCELNEVNFADRMSKQEYLTDRKYLTAQELESLGLQTGLMAKETKPTIKKSSVLSNISNIMRARIKANARVPTVNVKTQYHRMSYIADYI